MKTRLLYLLPVLLIFFEACVHKVTPTPANIPSGTFTGKFTLAHLVSKTGKLDTSVKANLTLTMQAATGFTVTGDTATAHAGSYGSYVVSAPSSQIQFLDKTFPLNTTPTKAHLDGVYDYRYDGTTLQMAAYGPLDTLEYYYVMTRTGN